MTELEQKFLDALKTSESGDYKESLKSFEEILEADINGELADDALFNIGVLYFKQEQFDKAEHSFKRIIDEYPDSTIAEFDNSIEHGATPAKALLGLINCYLAMGNEAEAWSSLEKLESYKDSYVDVTDNSGSIIKKTFKDLAQELLDNYSSTKHEMEQIK